LRPARYGPPRLTKTTVNTKLTAALSLIEPAIMIFMDMFVAFLLIALYNARFYR
jgi:type II secretory pathway component PulF